VRRQSYRVAHALLPNAVRLRVRRIVRGAEREQRRAAERAARQREKELRVELKDKVSAARAARSRSQGP
jgi:hypothetical protein